MASPRIGKAMTAAIMAGGLAAGVYRAVLASDHLDTPTVMADPAADIGDMFAWMSPDGRRLNMVMDIVGKKFSDQLQYAFHVDSGRRLGPTTATTTIVCRFDVAQTAECWAGNADYLHGDASADSGLVGQRRRFRVMAGLRDDPFFNNVRGARAMYQVAGAAMQGGARLDGASCPAFDAATSRAILDAWRHTDGGPATNFLAGWTSSAIVVSVDLGLVNAGGSMLAVWGSVRKAPDESPVRSLLESLRGTPALPPLGEQIERDARPLIKNALVGGPLAGDADSYRRREAYNRAARTDWARFAGDIANTLGLYDGLDGDCGSQWLADSTAHPSLRYTALATLLADDRLWVNSAATTCTQFLAVELAAFHSPDADPGDCGGRTPTEDASNIFRSLLANGTQRGVDDGLSRDEKVHSVTTFPFLASP